MLAYPTDGSVQGPCPEGYLFFGKPACGCSLHDCRPNAETAARLPLRTAARPTVDFSQPTTIETVYLFGAETTGAVPAQLGGNWADVQRTAQQNGWHGDVAIVEIVKSKDWDEEISRRILGTVTV